MLLDEWTGQANWLKANQNHDLPIFFALLLKTSGSTLRKAGAFCWFTVERAEAGFNSDGQASGVLSGGSMEKALYRAANDMHKDDVASSIIHFDSRDPYDAWLGYGKGCPGAALILVHRIDPKIIPDLLCFLNPEHGATETAQTWQLAVHLDGLDLGPRSCEILVVPSANANRPWDEKTPKFLLHGPPAKHLIVIARHQDVRPFLELARQLRWQIRLIAPDDLMIDLDPTITRTDLNEGLSQALAFSPAPERTAVISLSHKFEDDLAILQQTKDRPFFYRGVMGGQLKRELLLQELTKDITDSVFAFSCPIGMPRGGDSPGHIALSVLAELEARLASNAPTCLREMPVECLP